MVLAAVALVGCSHATGQAKRAPATTATVAPIPAVATSVPRVPAEGVRSPGVDAVPIPCPNGRADLICLRLADGSVAYGMP